MIKNKLTYELTFKNGHGFFDMENVDEVYFGLLASHSYNMQLQEQINIVNFVIKNNLSYEQYTNKYLEFV